MVYCCFIIGIITTAVFTCVLCGHFEEKRAAKNPYDPRYFPESNDDEDYRAIAELQHIVEHTYLKSREEACKHAILAIRQNKSWRKRCDMLEDRLREQQYENRL